MPRTARQHFFISSPLRRRTLSLAGLEAPLGAPLTAGSTAHGPDGSRWVTPRSLDVCERAHYGAGMLERGGVPLKSEFKKPGFLSTFLLRLRARTIYFKATIGGLFKSAVFGGQYFDRLFRHTGQLVSTASMAPEEKRAANVFFQHREKAETTLCAATSWYGGDYFEFGSRDLSTFRNMLTAFDLCELQSQFPNTRFYAFDIFGKAHSDNA